jgi:hypothetical protein
VAIGESAHTAYRRPREKRGYYQAAHHLGGLALRVVACPLVVLVAVAAGTGWLYLMRSWHVLGIGPGVHGSLELERLAAGDAQPLLRLAAAWVPAGIAAGLVLRTLVPVRGAVLALGAGAFALVLVMTLGAVSNAVENSETVGRHIAAQPGRAGPWVAAGLVVIGAYLGARVPMARRARAAPASILR